MTGIVITHEIRLSADTLLVLHELADRVIAAMREYQGAGSKGGHVPEPGHRDIGEAAMSPQADVAGMAVAAAVPPAVTGLDAEVSAPAAEPAVGSVAGIEVWHTAARKSVLSRLFVTNLAPGDIIKALDDIEGPPLPKWETIYGYAYTVLKLRRPKAAVETRPSPSTPNKLTAALKLPDQPIDTSEPIRADFATIRAKAGTWGQRFDSWDDLPALNAHAQRIGHRPFMREHAR